MWFNVTYVGTVPCNTVLLNAEKPVGVSLTITAIGTSDR